MWSTPSKFPSDTQNHLTAPAASFSSFVTCCMVWIWALGVSIWYSTSLGESIEMTSVFSHFLSSFSSFNKWKTFVVLFHIAFPFWIFLISSPVSTSSLLWLHTSVPFTKSNLQTYFSRLPSRSFFIAPSVHRSPPAFSSSLPFHPTSLDSPVNSAPHPHVCPSSERWWREERGKWEEGSRDCVSLDLTSAFWAPSSLLSTMGLWQMESQLGTHTHTQTGKVISLYPTALPRVKYR